MESFDQLIQQSAGMHRHLCPRQMLGIRMGLLAGEILGIELPQKDKRLLTIMETDGCALDGVAVATNCRVGRRSMRLEDYGKVAATFVDTETSSAIRVVPRADARIRAREYAIEAGSKWRAQLIGYRRMPAEQLFCVQVVELKTPIAQIVSRAGRKAICYRCGEEIINEREVIKHGATFCRACTGDSYYNLAIFDVVPLTNKIEIG